MPTASEQLEGWLKGEGDKTLGGLIETFEEKSFALLFLLLLGLPALPLPTGGATHVFEIIAMLLALQLIVGRDTIWLPDRWRRLSLAGKNRERFLTKLMAFIRWLEKYSRRRLGFLFGHRASGAVFGVLVLAGTLAAFLAPPFSGLDTLPALGVVLISVSLLMEDAALAIAGVLVAAVGVALEIALGSAIVSGIGHLV